MYIYISVNWFDPDLQDLAEVWSPNRTGFGNHSTDMIQIHNFITEAEPALETILLTQFRFITSLHMHWDLNRASVGCPNYLSICLCLSVCQEIDFPSVCMQDKHAGEE